MLELGLRLLAPKLPPAIGNDTVHCYSTRPGGMYFLDGPSHLRFCYPNDSRLALANHFAWQHRTDERGLRNPPNCESEVLLLGDSFIYGHGVEESQNLAARLRTDHGWKVYNLARQGDGLTEQFVLFQLYRQELKPKRILLFAFVNDFGDITQVRSPEEMARPPELADTYIQELRTRLTDPSQRVTTGHWFDCLYTVRFVATLLELNGRRNQPGGPYRAAQWVEALTLKEKFQPISAYYDQLIGQLQASGAELVIIDVDTASEHPEWSTCQDLFSGFLKSLCQQRKLRYLSLRPLFKGHAENVLPGDGHLSPEGHKALAELLVSSLGESAPAPAGASPSQDGKQGRSR